MGTKNLTEIFSPTNIVFIGDDLSLLGSGSALEGKVLQADGNGNVSWSQVSLAEQVDFGLITTDPTSTEDFGDLS